MLEQTSELFHPTEIPSVAGSSPALTTSQAKAGNALLW